MVLEFSFKFLRASRFSCKVIYLLLINRSVDLLCNFPMVCLSSHDELALILFLRKYRNVHVRCIWDKVGVLGCFLTVLFPRSIYRLL